MWTSTGGDSQTGHALDLVADLRADRGGHLGEVQAVLDDDVEPDRHGARATADLRRPGAPDRV